jgi:hypothetical protein
VALLQSHLEANLADKDRYLSSADLRPAARPADR